MNRIYYVPSFKSAETETIDAAAPSPIVVVSFACTELLNY